MIIFTYSSRSQSIFVVLHQSMCHSFFTDVGKEMTPMRRYTREHTQLSLFRLNIVLLVVQDSSIV